MNDISFTEELATYRPIQHHNGICRISDT